MCLHSPGHSVLCYIYIYTVYIIYTVDSPSKGRLGTIEVVLCMEVSLTWKVLLEYHTSINLTFNTKHYNNESATIKKIIIYNE